MNLSLVETMSWTLWIATAGASAKKWLTRALPQSISCQVRDAFAFEPEHRLLRLVEGDVDAQS
jgi:hypothetical protein